MKKQKRISSKKKCPQVRRQLGTSDNTKLHHDNSPVAQRARILRWFFNKSQQLSTLDAREELGIMSPACRIMELREMGHVIALEWKHQEDVTGTSHRTGVYVYMRFIEIAQRKEGVACHV
jgi:hypothetical protein